MSLIREVGNSSLLSTRLSSLRCPECGGALVTRPDDGFDCDRGHRYPIVRGVLRLAGDGYATSFGYQWNRFARTQLDSANGTTESRDTFLQKTGFTLAELRGKKVLDVGCGMGRFLEVVADAGAEVVGFDLSSAVDAAYVNVGSRPNVTILQADVFRLPFAEESFDFIYSIGVLHHTPDTRAAFLGLPPLLKPGGRLAIWVYGTRLKAFFVSRLVRHLTRRMPPAALVAVCSIARPWGGFLRKMPRGWPRFLLHFGLNVSLHPDPEWRVLDTFDWYSPWYQHFHSQEELRSWFREAGLADIRDLPFPVSAIGRRPAIGDARP